MARRGGNGDSLAAVLAVDPAAVGDPAALTSCVLRLNARIDEVRANVYETVNQHYREFSATLASALDIHSRVVELGQAVETLTQRLDDPQGGLRARLTNPAREYAQLKQQLSATDGVVAALRQLTRMHDLLQQFDSTLELGEYQRAAATLREIGGILRELPRNKENSLDADVLQLIKGEYERKKATLRARLTELFAKAVSVRASGAESVITVTPRLTGTLANEHFDNPASLTDVLGAMDTFGTLNMAASALLGRVMELVVLPIVQVPDVKIDLASVPKVSTSLVVQRPKDRTHAAASEPAAASPAARVITQQVMGTVYKNLLHVFEFLAGDVFPKPYGAAVLPQCWDALAAAVIAHVLKPSVPDDEPGLLAFSQKQGVITRQFEDEMARLRVCADDKRRLSAWAREIHVHFWAKRRSAALMMARDILASADHNSVQVTDATERGGLTVSPEEKAKGPADAAVAPAPGKAGKEGLEEGVFRLQTCHVSVRTQSFVELVYQTLGECANVEPAGAVQLYYSARDMLDLFRAVVPVLHANEIDNVPLLSMLFVCDCLYIAHHLMTLGPQFQEYLPPPLKDTATFVDMVPMFRRLADLQYQQQMTKQRMQILEFMGSCNGFANTHTDKRYGEVESGLKQALHLLGLLARVWKPIMPTQLYCASMGSLANALLEAVCAGVQALKDISEEEAHQLHQLCQHVLRQVAPLFMIKTAASAAPTTVPPAKHCAHWERLELLDRLLEMSLTDIDNSFSAGKLALLPRAELRQLVCALFTDTPKREAVLRKMRE